MAKTASRIVAPPAKAAAPAKAAPKPALKASVPATVEFKVPALGDQNLPAHLQGRSSVGLENIDQSDMEIPRLKLIQGLSPELQEFNDLRAGNFFHTATETIFDEPFRVVPIYVQKEYILWNPLESGGGILARASDAVHWSPSSGEFDVKLDRKDGGHKVKWKLEKTVVQSGLALWGSTNPAVKGSPPAATQMYNILFGFPDHPELMPAVFTFQRSSIKIGRKFLTKVKLVCTKIPIFGAVFQMSSMDAGSDNVSYKMPNLVGGGFLLDEEMFATFEHMHDSFSTKGLNIKDVDSLSDEDGSNDIDDEKPKY